MCTLDRSRGVACNYRSRAGPVSTVCGTIKLSLIGRGASALEVLDGQLTLVVRY